MNNMNKLNEMGNMQNWMKRREMKWRRLCKCDEEPTFSNTGWIREYIEKTEFVTKGHDRMKMRMS
jgi:hypothetical protein